MLSFQDFGLLFFFHNNPEAEAERNYVHAVLNDKRERAHTSNFFRFCLWVILNEKPLNLEKRTYRVLSVLLLIYDFHQLRSIYK